MSDYFDGIHNLLKAEKYHEVLELVLNQKRNRIRKPYDTDLNHAWYVVGNIFYKRNDFDYAISCFKKALKHWTEDVETMCALANSYSEIDQPNKAAYWLLKALKISPANPTFLYNYANALFDLKRYQKAIKYYLQIPLEVHDIYELARKNVKKCRDHIRNENT